MPFMHGGRCLAVALVSLTIAGSLAAARVQPVGVRGTASLRRWTATPAAADATQYHYSLTARVRPLLFWITRAGIGGGRIARTRRADDTRTIEFLIGSDPDRAPMRINRWGYVAEMQHGGAAEIVGLMTEANEQTVEEGTRTLGGTKPGGHSFKAIRAAVADGEASAEVVRATFANDYTFRDLNELLGRLPEGGQPTARLRVPAGARPGFLLTLAELLDESVKAVRTARERSRTPGVPQVDTLAFVWDRGLFDLRLRGSRSVDRREAGSVACRCCVESEFEVHNRATGKNSGFRLTYPTEGTMSGIPVRMVYRPRWWLEAELTLNEVR
jgi:hypothetical protein